MQTADGMFGWLAASALGQAMRGQLWFYPIAETIHIIGLSILVGAVVMFDLRVLGVSKALPVDALGRHLLRWAIAALVLVVPTGVMMFSAHPHDFVTNNVFLLKLALIATAGVNALIFHVGVYRTVAAWNTSMPAPALAKFQTVLSLTIWFSVIACGRLLAYT